MTVAATKAETKLLPDGVQEWEAPLFSRQRPKGHSFQEMHRDHTAASDTQNGSAKANFLLSHQHASRNPLPCLLHEFLGEPHVTPREEVAGSSRA